YLTAVPEETIASHLIVDAGQQVSCDYLASDRARAKLQPTWRLRDIRQRRHWDSARRGRYARARSPPPAPPRSRRPRRAGTTTASAQRPAPRQPRRRQTNKARDR